MELAQDKDGILGTDLKFEISDNDDPSVINQDSYWVIVFGNGKS